MPSFAYVAKDRSGKTSRGTVTAATASEAAGMLRLENLIVVQLDAVGAKSSTSAKGANKPELSERGRVALKEKMFFTKQFYVMLKAGLGMILCLNNLYNQTENKYFKHVINEIRKDVEGGVSLSVAMAKFPKVFEKIFVHMIEAGEASGKLDTCFLRLNEFFEREYKLRKKVTGALVYPIIIIIVAILAVGILMTFVVPMFASMFSDSGKALPLITQIVMGISNFLRNFWYLIPVFVAACIFGYRAARKNPKGSAVLDQIWLKAPIVGDLILKLAVSRFTRTLATLLDSGVPIIQSLEIVQRAVNNAVVGGLIQKATLSVSRGTGLAAPLGDSNIMPPMVTQMISIGEETGDLSRLLAEVSDYYDKEVEYAVENLTAMIEPVIIVFLGGVVGVIVVSIYLPMFDLSSGATL